MLEGTITVAVTIGSILVFCYWFRYTCRLLLRTATPRDCAENVAQVHQLGFPEARLRLRHSATELERLSAELDHLRDMLDHDYATLTCLMHQVNGTQEGIERRMLAIHYSLMAAGYRASRRISPAAAQKALEEMSAVVAYFANSIGEGAASAA
jgi:hypothetical protein